MDQNHADDGRFATLMRAAQGGDRHAYVQLLEEVTPRLRQAVRNRRRFLGPEDIEDLVQDVLLSLHLVRATYDPSRPFWPWLAAIMRNRLADAARRHARQTAADLAACDPTVTFSAEVANKSDAYGDPEALKQAIDRLPRGQREAITMLKLGEMSLQEAAAASGMSTGALKVAVHRGVNALRKTLRVGGRA